MSDPANHPALIPALSLRHDEASQQALFDTLTREIYQAGAGMTPWLTPVQSMARAFDAWAVQLFGVDRRDGSVLFSYEAGPAIVDTPQVTLDFIRTYRFLDQRVELVMQLPVGEWLACHEHFDDDFVAQSAFYQDFLIPYGGRYTMGNRLAEDEAKIVFIGIITKTILSPARRALAERLSPHLVQAVATKEHLQRMMQHSSVGLELLARMRQPVLLVDGDRRITFCNRPAQAILQEGDLLIERGQLLVCADTRASVDLTLAIRDMVLTPANAHLGMQPRAERRSVKLKRAGTGAPVVVTLLAFRPEAMMGAFGSSAQALVTIYEPGRMAEPDPFLLAATFDLTPAESLLAARLCAGATLQEIGAERQVSQATLKSQLSAVFGKTGTKRQSDLVRLLLSASLF